MFCCFDPQEPSNRVCSVPPALVMLDSSNSALFADLESLDFIPSRDNDTLHVFYVKQNQKTAHDILSNVVRCPYASQLLPAHLQWCVLAHTP